MKPTKEQEQKFWEWCGLDLVVVNPFFSGGISGPPGWYLDGTFLEEDIPIDLNNLFEYAVPKLSADYYITLAYDRFEKIWRGEIAKDESYVTAENQDPALALFWAIHKVIV